MEIEWEEKALEDFDRLDKPVADRVLKKLDWVATHYDLVTPDPLTGKYKGTFKIRAGDWRVLYVLEGTKIVIKAVAHRSSIYKI